MNFLSLFYNLFMQPDFKNKSREYILALQEKRFRKILHHAYHHSPFYRKYYSEHGIKAYALATVPLSALPPINKQIFRENFDALVTDSRISTAGITKFLEKEALTAKNYLGRYHIVHSSGSSGKPTYYVYDTAAWQQVLASQFHTFKQNVKPAELIAYLKHGVRVLYIAATGGRYAGAAVARYAKGNPVIRLKLLDVNTPLGEWKSILESFAPNIITGYPSAIKILCTLVEKHNINLNVARVGSVGEPLTQATRRYIEAILDCKMVNVYGAGESLVMGIELPGNDFLYMRDDLQCFEMEKDCTYITTLYNYVQPLIRYRMSDVLVKRAVRTYNAPAFTQVEKVLGRDEDLMWFTGEKGNEDFLHPLVLDDLNISGLLHYQFFQESAARFTIRIVTEKASSLAFIEKQIRNTISPILEQKRLGNITYSITQMDAIPINPETGKSSLVTKAGNLK